jgi:hypothetical protein
MTHLEIFIVQDIDAPVSKRASAGDLDAPTVVGLLDHSD